MSTPLARVVVVTWNGAKFLPKCLDALADQSLRRSRYEICVVDNGSTDETQAILAEQYPDVSVVSLPENGGFAVGCNAGISGSTAPYIVLVNNDAVVEREFIASLIAPLDSDPMLGATTARLVLAGCFRQARPAEAPTLVGPGPPGGRQAFVRDPAGILLMNSSGVEITRSGNGRDRDWLVPLDRENSPANVFGFCGGAAALRRAALLQVGQFDERLFLYYEDAELSWRLRRAGWHISYVREAVAYHEHAASSGRGSDLFLTNTEANRLIVATRHAPWPVVARALFRYAARTMAAVVTDRRSLARRGHVLGTYAKSFPACLRGRWARRSVVSIRDVGKELVAD